MVKKYFHIILFFLLISFASQAQDFKNTIKNQESSIEGLNFYPNPVTNGKIYITSKSSLDKEVTIYDVLGKKVHSSEVNNKELNISSLIPGIYIIKIKEGDYTATRKLIVK